MSHKLDIYLYRDYLKERYGEILHRVPVDVSYSCPHRTGGSGGCLFCAEDGARAPQLGDSKTLEEQLKRSMLFAQRRYAASAFMAYFQSYTNTYMEVAELARLVDRVMAYHPFKALVFGTRPDCLGQEMLSYLKDLNSRIDVWVELGVQTVHDQTLALINRGHDWATSKEAIEQLNQRGIATAVHLIFGLPGEDLSHNLTTIREICGQPIAAIKLHNLHVLKQTGLARLYYEKPFTLFGEYQYAELLCQLLPHIPATLPIIRLTTDSPKEMLVAPQWTMSKGQFRKLLAAQMRNMGVAQGSALRNREKASAQEQWPGKGKLIARATDDGSLTYYNEAVKEHYHSLAGARSEAEKKYVEPGLLEKRLGQGPVRLLDICFGLGYNSLISCEKALELGGQLTITALEIDRTVVARAAQEKGLQRAGLDWQSCLKSLVAGDSWNQEGIGITLLWGDARYTVAKLSGPFDLIWLDPFSPQKSSELWSLDFCRQLKELLAADGALLTYCAAIPVRSALLQAGFFVGETRAFGRDRGGTIASLDPGLITLPLDERDRHLLGTSRAICYRDPNGTRTHKEILRAREYEILKSKRGKED